MENDEKILVEDQRDLGGLISFAKWEVLGDTSLSPFEKLVYMFYGAQQGPLTSPDYISRRLKCTLPDVEKAVQTLLDKGYLVEN